MEKKVFNNSNSFIHNDLIRVTLHRKDILTILLACNVVIKATTRDHVPNESLVTARDALAAGLKEHIDHETRNKDPKTGKAAASDPA